MDKIEQVLDFWFEDVDEEIPLTKDSPVIQRWFGRDDQLDQEIKRKFGALHTRASKDKLNEWLLSTEGQLALIIVLDQFSRNIYRDSIQAYDNDLKALEYALKMTKDGFDQDLPIFQRQFVYMPLIHSENIKIQERAIEYFQELLTEAHEKTHPSISYFEDLLNYAKQHVEIIKTFGRFPQRNKVLKRKSTSAENEFLRQPAATF